MLYGGGISIESLPVETGQNGNITVYPSTIEQCSQLFKEAAEKRIKLSIRGNYSQGAAPSDRLAVSTLKLEQFRHILKEDLTLVVSAGAAYDTISGIMREFRCDIGEYSGTLGGCVCGWIDTMEHKLIVSRVMGLTWVTPAGEIIDLGSHSVKDVVGYRVASLLYGSRGRLGLISRVVLNLAPIHREFTILPDTGAEPKKTVSSPGRIVSGLIDILDSGRVFN